MQYCINEECETISFSYNQIKCSECGTPYDDYGMIDHSND